MSEHIMKKIKELLEKEDGVTDVSMYLTTEYDWVVRYEYEGEVYVIENSLIYDSWVLENLDKE